jgi:uncharacterized protein (TIGR02996 family)
MATVTLNEQLGLALEAFDRYDEGTALEHLLGAWRTTRSEPIAELIERLSRRLTGGLPRLQTDMDSERTRRHGPLDLPRFLMQVRALGDARQWVNLSYQLRAFRAWPADPRFTPVLLALVERPGAFEKNVFQAFCELFSAMRDPRAVEPLRALRKTLSPGSAQKEHLDMALHVIRSSTPLGDADAATCAALERALSAREEAESRRTPTHQALLERVYADPADMSARMVLADHLLEQGNPLGELIVLQCMPQADRQRTARLLEEHGWRWVSALGPHVDVLTARFERGFPAAVRLNPHWHEPLPTPVPDWATVREVDVAGGLFPDLAAWLSFPELKGVTVLRRVEPTLAWSFGAQALGVRRLGLLGPVARKAPLLFPELERLPYLSRLLIHDADPEDVQLCATSPMAPMLERFEARNVGAWAFVAMPAKGAPLRATLLGEAGAESLARVIRGAVGFGRAALQVRGQGRATPEGLRLLKAAAAPYARVAWT